jgi:hypothetical protein
MFLQKSRSPGQGLNPELSACDAVSPSALQHPVTVTLPHSLTFQLGLLWASHSDQLLLDVSTHDFKPCPPLLGSPVWHFRDRCIRPSIYAEGPTIMHWLTKHRHGSSPSCLGPASFIGANIHEPAESITQLSAVPTGS